MSERKDRRGAVPENDKRTVTFSERKLSAEKLEALKVFLATASPDDVAMVRQSYADMPEVLQTIALELRKQRPQE
jgi:hypothetical protein